MFNLVRDFGFCKKTFPGLGLTGLKSLTARLSVFVVFARFRSCLARLAAPVCGNEKTYKYAESNGDARPSI